MSSGAAAAAGRMYLIDAHSLIFQVFHAIPEMSSPSGLPTNAVFGFTRDLMFLRQEKKPDYLVCAFDVDGPTFREQIFPEYKAHREPLPNDLQLQIPLIRQVLDAMRIPVLGVPGYEADDLLATVARAAEQRGLDVFLCTSDKDCRQLITDRVRLYNLRKRKEFGRAELLAEWGITPEQVVDFQVLVGDPVDNIKGVPGIGPKTAALLLQQFGSLENILANLDRVPGAKRQENLRAFADKVEPTRRLVRLATDAPVAFDWEGWRLQEWDAPRLLALFQEWGFRGLANQVRAAQPLPSPLPSPSGEGEGKGEGGQQQGELFAADELFPFGANLAGEKDGSWKANYHLVDTPEKLQTFLQELRQQKRIAFDLETTGLQPLECEVVGYAFAWKAGEAWYLPVRGPAKDPVLDPDATLEKLRRVLEDPAVAKVNQNIKFDLVVLRGQGVEVAGVRDDPMVADYLLHAGERSHGLEELALRYLNHAVTPITDLIGKRGKNQLRMDQVSTARVARYAGEDADVAWRLAELLDRELEKENLKKLYDELEVPLIEVLAELEYNGIRLDIPLLMRLSKEMERQLADIEQEIYRLAGHPFNIASPKQLRQVLFTELQLPAQRRTDTTGEASTDQETLERLAALHELPRKILEHRQIAKLKGTYVDALPALVNPRTGRVHASFNQTVAATGRLSSSDPNLQNIPVRREQGRQIRQAFLPEKGWKLLTADYSQIELRLLAHFSGDEHLRRAFALDQDIHAAVAAQIFGVPEKDVTAEMRRMAKTVNFGVIYGISAHGLAARLGISKEEAARFIDAYFARYPKVKEYQARLLEKCRQTGYVGTILGRRRAIRGIRPDSTYQQRNQPEREAINMEIQGSAADLIKLAMLNIHRRLRAEKRRARMLLQIHDELVLEAPPGEFDEVAELVREEMTTPLEKALKLEVPLKVDLAGGPNWLDVEEVREAVTAVTARR
ncbi:MAG TPA: DNA polymerase I [Gemmataceae bacterium]|nr:DNA polymerase I [Gemmataceae bacterium]